MPGKKEQIALQKEVTSQEQWEELLSTEGVTVIDVYQRWCGPCNALVSLFRRMKNETGDDLLKLAVAEADSIDTLEKYRGQCQPCFLFYAGGQLVHVIRGVQGPALVKSILKQLEAEHKVLDNGAERKIVVDPLLAQEAAKERARSAADVEAKKRASAEALSQELEGLGLGLRPVSQDTMDTLTSNIPSAEPVSKEVTVVVIKPDAVKSGKTEEIMERLASLDLEIIAHEQRMLTEDEAREFYKAQEGQDHFESLVKFMASGPCHILVVTKGGTGRGVVSEVRSLLGPKDISIAKEESPESLRALYGTDTTMNALHGADSAEMAARELTFFFPDFRVPTVAGTGPHPKLEKTLALIRPEALKEHRDEILEKIQEAGFEVCLQKEVQLTGEQARDFYKEHEGQPFYDELIAEMTKGPILALGLAREAAIQGWRNMLGPKEVEKAKEEAPESLRAQFSSTSINPLHGSDSDKSAQNELEFFFPKEHTMAVIKPDAAGKHKDAIIERLEEAGFQIASEKHIPLSREMAAQLYHEHEGKEFYESLLDHMTSGPSTMLLLNREDAIQGLRTLMGPADPDLAREQAPESFRALLGRDILHNAIHGSSSLDQVNKKIEHFFPDVELTEDGQIVVPEVKQPETSREEPGFTERESSGVDDLSSKEHGSQYQPIIAVDGEVLKVDSSPGEMSEGQEYFPQEGKGDVIEPDDPKDDLLSKMEDNMGEGNDEGKGTATAAGETSQDNMDGQGNEGSEESGDAAEKTVVTTGVGETVGDVVEVGDSGLVEEDGKGDEQLDNKGESEEGEGGIVRDDATSLGAEERHRGHDDDTGSRNEGEEVETDDDDQPITEPSGEERTEGPEGEEETVETATLEEQPSASTDVPEADDKPAADDAPAPTEDVPPPNDDDSTPKEDPPRDDTPASKEGDPDGDTPPSEEAASSGEAPPSEEAPRSEDVPQTADDPADTASVTATPEPDKDAPGDEGENEGTPPDDKPVTDDQQ